MKTGISGQPLNKNGSSPTANAQVNKFNLQAGSNVYSARVVKTGMKNRDIALKWEAENSMKLWYEQNNMYLHKKPRPWE